MTGGHDRTVDPHRARRRAFLLAAAGGLLALPSDAAAADPDPALLLELFAREDAAAVAYRRAAPEPLPGIAAQAADHVAALRTELDAFGRTPRPARLDPVARRLAESTETGRLDAAIALEASLVEAYSEALLELEVAGVLQAAASILASHAQHHARLRSRAGRDPFG
jgi:hypothetical protein